jgi:23S rRNA pseudouridine2605 synthase
MVRLNKLLASWGLASRRTVETWITAGRVAVDGRLVEGQGLQVDPATVLITVDGRPVGPPAGEKGPIVWAFHKPFDVLSSLADPHGGTLLTAFLPPQPRVYPIGRLDRDSTGLLLLTNDGDLTHRLLHPRFKVEKEYLVVIAPPALTHDERRRFAQGLGLEDGITAPCHIMPQRLAPSSGTKESSPTVSEQSAGVAYRVILREGRKRQIRRMFAALDRRVVSLHRCRFGPIDLGDLAPGTWRPLTSSELTTLRQAVSASTLSVVEKDSTGNKSVKGPGRSGGKSSPRTPVRGL